MEQQEAEQMEAVGYQKELEQREAVEQQKVTQKGSRENDAKK